MSTFVEEATTDVEPVVQQADIPRKDSPRLTIIGIGASAGGLAALRGFFRALPSGSGRERLGLFGGRMEIHAAPGQGTRITLSVPIATSMWTTMPSKGV